MAGRHDTPLGYCDKTDIENFLLTTIDSSFNAQIDDWIAAAEHYVNGYMGYTTASGILREQIVGEKTRVRVNTNGDLIFFPLKIPVVSISSVSIGQGTTNLTMTLADSNNNPYYDIPSSADQVLFSAAQLNYSGTSTLRSYGDLRGGSAFTSLSYIAGYETVPPDIRMATVNVVSDYVMRHSNKEGLEGLSQGRITKRWYQRNQDGDSDFLKDAKELLNGYKIASRWL